MSFEEGALLEPLSVALAGIERSGLRLGDNLVICGAGPIGMVTLLAAHAAGAGPIVITDLDESRLALAKKLVPRVRTVQIQKADDAQQSAERVKSALGAEAKLVIECTGVQSSIHTGIYVCSHRMPLSMNENADFLITQGFSVWWRCVHHRCRKRHSRNPVHERLLPGNRYSFSISVPRDIPEGDHAGVGRFD